jgi:DNA polymerase III epsilon subunit-like protein
MPGDLAILAIIVVFAVVLVLASRRKSGTVEPEHEEREGSQADSVQTLETPTLKETSIQAVRVPSREDKDQRAFVEKKYRSPKGVQSEAKWKKLIFVDCETTGLTIEDRIVSLSALFVDLTEADSDGKANVEIKCLHRAYNPQRNSHVAAKRVHGLSSEFLGKQPLFSAEAQEVREFMEQGHLMVAHNVEFDLGMLNREFKRAGLAPMSMETLCTMQLWRVKGLQGSAGLRNIAKHLGYDFKSGKHCSFEDVCMCFRVFAYELNLPLTRFEVTGDQTFQNTPD